MIRLLKTAIPAVLEQNAAAWTQTLLSHKQAGTEPSESDKSHYRHPDIKSALLAETREKCAYCESKVRHVTYGDIEHITPKSTDIRKTFEWSNLTLACDVCNTNKGAHFGNHEDLVDPYTVEPSEHLNFIGAMVLSKPGSGPGQATETMLKLNRIPLIERRAERLLALNKILHLLVETADGGKRAVLRKDIESNELASDKEYAAMARSFVSAQLRRIDMVQNAIDVASNPKKEPSASI